MRTRARQSRSLDVGGVHARGRTGQPGARSRASLAASLPPRRHRRRAARGQVSGCLGDRSAGIGSSRSKGNELGLRSGAIHCRSATHAMGQDRSRGAIVINIDRGSGTRRVAPGRDGIGYTPVATGVSFKPSCSRSAAMATVWTWSTRPSASRCRHRSGKRAVDLELAPPYYHVQWLSSALGLDLPTEQAGIGRIFGYTDLAVRQLSVPSVRPVWSGPWWCQVARWATARLHATRLMAPDRRSLSAGGLTGA